LPRRRLHPAELVGGRQELPGSDPFQRIPDRVRPQPPAENTTGWPPTSTPPAAAVQPSDPPDPPAGPAPRTCSRRLPGRGPFTAARRPDPPASDLPGAAVAWLRAGCVAGILSWGLGKDSPFDYALAAFQLLIGGVAARAPAALGPPGRRGRPGGPQRGLDLRRDLLGRDFRSLLGLAARGAVGSGRRSPHGVRVRGVHRTSLLMRLLRELLLDQGLQVVAHRLDGRRPVRMVLRELIADLLGDARLPGGLEEDVQGELPQRRPRLLLGRSLGHRCFRGGGRLRRGLLGRRL